LEPGHNRHVLDKSDRSPESWPT